MATIAEFVDRYFELAPRRDPEPYIAQFTSDAVVEDEGKTYRGVEAIRQWRRAVPEVNYAVLWDHDRRPQRRGPRPDRR